MLQLNSLLQHFTCAFPFSWFEQQTPAIESPWIQDRKKQSHFLWRIRASRGWSVI